MKTIILLIGLICCLAPAFSQTIISATHIDSLEGDYQACLDKGTGMLRCSSIFYTKMDSFLNVAYHQLQEKLNVPSKVALKSEQLAWLKARDTEFKRIDAANQEEGHDGQMFRKDLKTDFVKKRVLNLIKRLASAKQYLTLSDNLHIIEASVHSTLSHPTSCYIKKISIYTKDKKKLLQTIIPPENSFFCSQREAFLLEDINFDGLNDFMVIQFNPAGANTPYYYWAFNKTTKRFQRDTTLEDITSPEFDKKSKLVFSSWRSSCCERGANTYKYVNGKITLIKEYEETIDQLNSDQLILTTKKLINGKMRVVERTVEKRLED